VTSENEKLILAQYEAIKAKDLTTFMSRCTEDIVLLEADSMPVPSETRGRDDVQKVLDALLGTFDTSRMHPVRLVADGDYVTAMLRFHVGPPVDYEVMITEWWHIRDGQVAEIRPFYWDTQELNQKLTGGTES
jgi:ketosteroid isomerase-like protein